MIVKAKVKICFEVVVTLTTIIDNLKCKVNSNIKLLIPIKQNFKYAGFCQLLV